MIPTTTFNLLMAIDLVFILFAVIDHRNRLYANIVIAVASAILAAFIAAAAVSGAVYDVVGTTESVINSPSLQNLFNFISTVMFIYTALMVYEAVDDILAAKREKKGLGGD